MPRSLAQGRTKLAIFTSEPTGDLAALPATALNDAIDAACAIAMADFNLGASDEETTDEQALCETVASEVPTSSKYEGNITPFRYFTDQHASDPVADEVWQAVKTQGTTLWIARRDTSRLSKDPWTAGDEYKIYEVITGEPRENPQEGYIKHPVKLYVQTRTDGVVAS